KYFRIGHMGASVVDAERDDIDKIIWVGYCSCFFLGLGLGLGSCTDFVPLFLVLVFVSGGWVPWTVFPPIVKAFGGAGSVRGNTGPFWIASGLCVVGALVSVFFVHPLTQEGIEREDREFRAYLEMHGYDTRRMGTGTGTGTVGGSSSASASASGSGSGSSDGNGDEGEKRGDEGEKAVYKTNCKRVDFQFTDDKQAAGLRARNIRATPPRPC
ncbi:hypothetical protein E4T56_gene3961, partial [Termitomyces sp. T112]